MERRAYSYQRKCDANVFAPFIIWI